MRVRTLLLSLAFAGGSVIAAPMSTRAITAPLLAGAQPQAGGVIAGRVTSQGTAVPFATVSVQGSATVTGEADGQGRFRLERVAAGAQTLEVRAVGFAVASRRAEVRPGEVTWVDVELVPSAVALDALVVTGTMQERTVGESAVKVDLVSGRMLQRLATNSLTESIQHVNGLYQQIDCGVCYTNNIRINGMEGPYTAVLIDGMPVMGGLASVYGLSGIDPALVEQLEIVKGPSSTLYGTEAMGGVVNVILKDPRFAPRLTVDAWQSADGESSAQVALAPRVGRVHGLVSGSFARSQRFVDRNDDGFSDFPKLTRATVFARADVLSERRRRVAGVTAKVYAEDRFGGVRDWTRADRGSDEVYGEFIRTRRAELMGVTRVPGLPASFRADLSLTVHDQESWYGDVRYDARQDIAFGNLLWQGGRNGHDVLLGATARYQVYDDGTPATPQAERRFIPGVFAQDEYSPFAGLSLLGGLRLDRHEEHGAILSPRASLKWEPFHDTRVRVNAGTGFRVVSLFAEDHAALTGARQVVVAETLRPERSWSVTGNVNQVIEFGVNPMMIDVDVFHTRFTNRIVADYDTDPNLIIYDNLDGDATTRGVSLSLNQNFARVPFLYTAGITIQDVSVRRAGVREAEFFAPDWKAVWSASYTFAGPGVTVDYTGTAVGPMRLPEYAPPFTRPTRSPTYSVHNVKATARVAAGMEIYGALNNLFDFRQGSPLIAPHDPFGDAFDTTYVWGPIRGRQILLGGRVGVSR
jgi:outer membrane receptor for ferrienterochelin and colicins